MRGLLQNKSAGSQLLLLISVALVSFFLFGMIGTLALSLITGISLGELGDPSKWDYTKPGFLTFIRGMQFVQFISLFLIPTIICTWLFSNNFKNYLGLKRPSNRTYYIVGIGIMVIAIPLVNWLGALNQNFQFPDEWVEWMRRSEDEASKTVKALLSKQTIPDLLINIVCIAGLAAVGEELFFRGMVQRLLIKMFKNHWAGIIVAAFLFAAMHMQFYGFLPRFMLGIVLGMTYWYSGSLWTAIAAHFVYDALLIILVYFNPSMLEDDAVAATTSLAIAGSISFVLVAVLLEWMRKKSVTTYSSVYSDDEKPVKDHPFD